jgi:hypothetical protein
MPTEPDRANGVPAALRTRGGHARPQGSVAAESACLGPAGCGRDPGVARGAWDRHLRPRPRSRVARRQGPSGWHGQKAWLRWLPTVVPLRSRRIRLRPIRTRATVVGDDLEGAERCRQRANAEDVVEPAHQGAFNSGSRSGSARRPPARTVQPPGSAWPVLGTWDATGQYARPTLEPGTAASGSSSLWGQPWAARRSAIRTLHSWSRASKVCSAKQPSKPYCQVGSLSPGVSR